MPLSFVEPPATDAQFASPALRIFQQAQRFEAGGDPFADLLKPNEPRPTLGETWSAQAGTTLVQGILDAGAKLYSVPTLNDGEFNPYTFIKKNPGLANDPAVRVLVERGQFNGSMSEDGFWFDLAQGRRFLDDSDTLGRAGTFNTVVSTLGAIGGDPTNLIPIGIGAKAVRKGVTLMRMAEAATVAGGTAVFLEKVRNGLIPASNDPGFSNEVMAGLTSGGLAAGLTLLASPAVLGAGARYLSTRKLSAMRRDLERMVAEPAIRPIDPATVTTAEQLGHVPLSTEIERGRDFLRSVLADEPVDNRVVSALVRPGDESAAIVDALRMKYQLAGKSLHMVAHPDQWYYDLTADVRAILDHPAMNAEATPAELSASGLDEAVSALTRRYANFQASVTPGGRVATTALSRIADVYRTLSGSAQTVVRGSALDPFEYNAGPAAENIKGVYAGAKDSAILSLRRIYANARQSETPVSYNGASIPGRFGYSNFIRATNDFIRRENAVAQGFQTSLPADVHPAIREAAGSVRGYFQKIGREARRTGALPPEVNVEGGYLPRVYDTAAILANEADFRARLAGSFRRSDSVVGGRLVGDIERPVLPEVLEKLDPLEVARVRSEVESPMSTLFDGEPAAPRAILEGDLTPSLRVAYRAELDAYYQRNALAAYEKLTSPHERHGVADADASSPLARRVMTIDESELAPYLVGDLETLIDRYHRVVGGRVAVRRAIQLAPDLWGNVRLADGSAIEDGSGLVHYLRESVDSLERFAALSDQQAGRGLGEAGSALPDVRRLRDRIERDIRFPLDRLEGRNIHPEDAGAMAAMTYFGRNMVRLSFLNKMGSVAWAQLNDMAPVTMFMMQRPQTLRFLPAAMLDLRSLPKRDLEVVGLALDNISRTRALSDTDVLATGLGFGQGTTRKATAAIESGIGNMSDAMSRLTMMEYLTSMSKQVSGSLVIDRVTTLGRRLVRAKGLIDGGRPMADAFSAVGLAPYEAARLNKMGLNAERSARYSRLVYEHGLLSNDTPIRTAMTWEEFLSPKADRKLLKPNFEEWPMDVSTSEGAQNRDLFDTVSAGINGEVNRSMVVTPGEFDRPLVNNRMLGRMFNQFWSFSYAFANQRLRVMAQMPATYQAWYASVYFALGAVSDAISNDLSGRRSFQQTAVMWSTNPLGMSYAATERSGMLGWLGRPLAAADALGLPIGPRSLFGSDTGSSAARHVTAGRTLTMLGPVASDVDRMGMIAGELADPAQRDRAAYDAWKLAPAQNLVWLRLLHRATGLPVVPEAISRQTSGTQP